jgi:hypothetical protein
MDLPDLVRLMRIIYKTQSRLERNVSRREILNFGDII